MIFIFYHMLSAQVISTDKLEQTEVIVESTPLQTAEEPDKYTDSESSSSSASAPVVCSHYQLSKLQEQKRHSRGRYAAPTAGGQREAPLRLLPPILYRQGASPLHEGESAELRREVNRLRPRPHPAAAPNSVSLNSDQANT